MAITEPDEPRSVPAEVGWATGVIGSGLLLNMQGTLFLFFLSRVLAIPVSTAGILLVIAKVYNMVINPLMGVVSDRTRGPLGRRRPYLLAGAVIAGPMIALFFRIDPIGQSTTLLALAGLITIATGYTLFNVPFLAIPGEIGLSYHGRTRLMTLRHIANVLGVFLGTVVAPLILAAAMTPARGYRMVGLWAGAVITLAMLVTFFATGRWRPEAAAAPNATKGSYLAVLASRGFPTLLSAKFAAILAPALGQGALLFMITDVLAQSPKMLAVYGIAAIASNLVFVPMWTWLSRRLDKRRTLLIAYAGASLSHLSWLLAVPGEPIAGYVVRGLVIGMFVAGGLVVGYSMLPDVMALHRHTSGRRSEGAFAGLYSMAETTAFAGAPALLALLLGAHGGTTPDPGAIRLTLSFGPAVGYGLALVAIWFYPIDEHSIARRPVSDPADPALA